MGYLVDDLHLVFISSGDQDTGIWIPSLDGLFSSKSFSLLSRNSSCPTLFLVHKVWNFAIPPRVKAFSGWLLLVGKTQWKVGDGRRIKFWGDIWCGERSLRLEFLDVFTWTTASSLTVLDNYSVHGDEVIWAPKLRQALFDWEIPRVS